MLNLPDVTLVCIETREHDLAQLAIEDCERQAEFGDVLVFTDRPSQFMQADRRVITVPDWPDKIGWSRHFWTGIAPHMRTSHALCIQWDSWIVDPTMWRDEYLDFDYIGAPWWYKDGMNVGNGGFCLRSTKLMRFVHKHRAELPCVTSSDDDLYCRKYRPTLEAAGFVWANEKLAYNFAFECVRPDVTAKHFGFHAAFNFDYGCESNDERLLERAKMMARSDYISNHQWTAFKTKCPQIAQRAKEEVNG
jgi:hypothetical protein